MNPTLDQRPLLTGLLACALTLGIFGSAASASAPGGPGSPCMVLVGTDVEIKRLDAWPAADKRAVKTEVERLRKARVPEMGVQAAAALVELGAGAAPGLLEKYGKEKKADAQERMREVLEKITGPEHTRLLAEYFSHKDTGTRTWALTRVAGFPDAGVMAQAEKAFKAADGRKRGRDKDEVMAAAICSASAGSFEGFDLICAAAEESWKTRGKLIHTALTALRGPDATARVAKHLKDGSRKRKVAALRLLAACGDKTTAGPLVRPVLDSTDNTLRVAAINALRGIVDGDPPLEKLPVFEAIERANKWKSRL
jgi:hypothetical protein